MMELQITEEQKLAREMARRFCEKEIEPYGEALDREEMLPYDIIKKYLKEVIGGDAIESVEDIEAMQEGRDRMAHMLMMIEMAKVNSGVALSLGASIALAGYAILYAGTYEQKEKYALPIMRGDAIGAWGLTEPSAGSDVLGMKTTAVKDGDCYVLNGSKTFITNAPYADIFVIYAKTDPQAAPHKGISAFIVERGTEGLTTGKPLDKMGMRASPTGEIFMDDCRVPAENLLGRENSGFLDALNNLNHERASAAALAIGTIERCLEEATRYAKERVQFGQPIINNQAIQFKLARMYTDLAHSYAVLFLVEEMISREMDITMVASAAKLFTTEAATRAGLEAIQIMGGYGYMKEYNVERFMRDAKLMEIGAGTSEIQQMIIARQLISGDAKNLNPMDAGPDFFAQRARKKREERLAKEKEERGKA